MAVQDFRTVAEDTVKIGRIRKGLRAFFANKRHPNPNTHPQVARVAAAFRFLEQRFNDRLRSKLGPLQRVFSPGIAGAVRWRQIHSSTQGKARPDSRGPVGRGNRTYGPRPGAEHEKDAGSGISAARLPPRREGR